MKMQKNDFNTSINELKAALSARGKFVNPNVIFALTGLDSKVKRLEKLLRFETDVKSPKDFITDLKFEAAKIGVLEIFKKSLEISELLKHDFSKMVFAKLEINEKKECSNLVKIVPENQLYGISRQPFSGWISDEITIQQLKTIVYDSSIKMGYDLDHYPKNLAACIAGEMREVFHAIFDDISLNLTPVSDCKFKFDAGSFLDIKSEHVNEISDVMIFDIDFLNCCNIDVASHVFAEING